MSSSHKSSDLTKTIASTATLKLAELHAHNLFYTPIEARFERIIRVTRRALDVPVAAVTLVNSEKQWFKAIGGWSISELPLEQSLCWQTLDSMQLTIVSNTQENARLSQHPLVTGHPRIRFYAGYPLVDGSDVPQGTFCIMDIKPRHLTTRDQECFIDLAMMAQTELLTDRMVNAQGEFIAKLGTARREAMIDVLTRLWNRRGANMFLKKAIERANETQSDLALGMLDVDRFKQINDVHGHAAGDEALRKVGQVLTATLRSTDIACRYGGDEFVVILPGLDAKAAMSILDRLRNTIQNQQIRTRTGNIPITVSIGCAIRNRNNGMTDEQLLDAADRALSESKAGGRNQMRLTA